MAKELQQQKQSRVPQHTLPSLLSKTSLTFATTVVDVITSETRAASVDLSIEISSIWSVAESVHKIQWKLIEFWLAAHVTRGLSRYHKDQLLSQIWFCNDADDHVVGYTYYHVSASTELSTDLPSYDAIKYFKYPSQKTLISTKKKTLTSVKRPQMHLHWSRIVLQPDMSIFLPRAEKKQNSQ